jgi:hypothetical protein
MKQLYKFIKKFFLIINYYGEKAEKDMQYKKQKKNLHDKILKDKK